MTDDMSDFPRFGDIKNLHPSLKKGISNMGHTTMTEIQAKTWEAASAGKDVLGRARTGTGKTIAFMLPALQQLLQTKNLSKDQIHMLVLSPTRELAAQIGEQARQLTASNRISHQVIFGGTSKPKEVSQFNRVVPTILVATPGRLRDHLQTTTLRGNTPFSKVISQTQILVLDETDRLLDMGFRREVEDIISYLPGKSDRQTLLFSATVPPEVKAIMSKTMKSNHITADCIHDKDPSSHTNAQVEQTHVIVPSETRLVSGTIEILLHLMQKSNLKMVVFFPTTNMVAFYSAIFNEALGIHVLEIHSRKSQSFRTKASDKFREAEQGILFTSDVSARGVDYPSVTNVVQFGIPDSRESYIHRLGRTGRAGKLGEGLLVLTDLEREFLRKLGGLDIPNNPEMQSLIDGPPTRSDKINPILDSIGDGSNKSLEKSARDAYRSMLGFYNGKLSKLGVKGTDRLVNFCNSFAMQTGLTELPEIELKMARKMGLDKAEGLNLVKVSSSRQQKQNKRTASVSTKRQQGGTNNTVGEQPSNGGQERNNANSTSGEKSSSPHKRSNSIASRMDQTANTKKPRQETNNNGKPKSRRSRNRRASNKPSATS